MLGQHEYRTPTGYTWKEFTHLFLTQEKIAIPNSGFQYGIMRIHHVLHRIEYDRPFFTQYDAFAYLSTHARVEMVKISKTLNHVTLNYNDHLYPVHMHGYYMAYHLLHACVSNPYPPIDSLSYLARFLSAQKIGTCVQDIIHQINSGKYIDIPDFQQKSIEYLDEICSRNLPAGSINTPIVSYCYIFSLI